MARKSTSSCPPPWPISTRAQTATRAGIGKMKQAELLELLAAHGVEDTAGKTVADLRAMLIATVFIEG